MQWIDDELVFHNSNIPWIRGDQSSSISNWNCVAIGGNDHFKEHANELRYVEWYAIDDVLVRKSIPQDLTTLYKNKSK
jgi:hypothetical protein